ncbi:CorA family divalent cation transporter [Candidatus Micrarchaeota archaeon]|nr:CorA family divalent cation transporter [Candidatus Micrarchaeota archaeon]MBU1165898.1 CorA family divalent cation transporter [Candidatus Micrarchaeota archaeon]MBU1887107.1 CorA family divalent cation transporter [Candidatus Micrarchaeota archaeon]
MSLDKSLVDNLRKTNGSGKVILSLEQKGFCVSLFGDGTTTEREFRDPEELLSLIKPSSVSWIDYIVDDLARDAPNVVASLGFGPQIAESLLKGQSQSGYEDFDIEMGLLVPVIYAKGFEVTIQHLLVLLKRDVVVTIHTTEATRFFRLRRYGKIFMKKISRKKTKRDKITHILIRLLDENNSRNFDSLRGIEKCADVVSEKLSNSETPRDEIGKEIHAMKHALMVYLNGLWQTIDVLNTLRYGDPELLSDNRRLLERIGSLVIETNYQVELAEHMSQVLASGLEVMQSIYNNQLQILNNKLALIVTYLTVLGTAVLVPNTIATIFGVPFWSFGPEFVNTYLVIIVASTILSIVISYGWVKSTGLLPKRAD